jgi:hypothetical protein
MALEILNYNDIIITRAMSSAAEGQLNTSNTKVPDTIYKYECYVCRKIFDSLYILNYHELLEHSESRRPPIGIG